MAMISKFLPIVILISMAGCSKKSEQLSQVIYLQNKYTEVGILTEVGGRVVSLNHAGCANLLKSAPELWHLPVSQHPVCDGKNPSIKSYFGQIVWVGPQSEWWIHQDINPDLRQKVSPWPPDPYLIYGNYKILDRSDSFIIMQGPNSPISGIQLTKEIRLDDEGKVHFKVIGMNISENNIAWDLWCNMRLNALDRCYVPVEHESDIRIDHIHGGPDAVPWTIMDGYFTFLSQLPEEGRRTAKAYIYPKIGVIAAFKKDQLLLINFERIDRSRIHPDQGHVEIYINLMTDATAMILELEHHAAFCNLSAGQTMATEEIWEVIPYSGENTPEVHVAFLKNTLSKAYDL